MLMTNNTLGGFTTLKPHDGLIFDCTTDFLPSRVHGFVDEDTLSLNQSTSTYFGYVPSGPVTVTPAGASPIQLSAEQYFCATGPLTLSGDGSAVIFERLGFRAPMTVGGPLEATGRIVYIDGCSTSLLTFPQRQGDPVMNVLWFPENVRQTMHIHPTVRLAMVVHGQGVCHTPSGDVDLVAGKVFRLEAMAPHCFNTDDSRMAIVTYHPDSDWGPTDEIHPMMKQTIELEA